MEQIKTQEENPKGLHLRYKIQKIVGYKKEQVGRKYNGLHKVGLPTAELSTPILEDVDESAEYFVLRLDDGGSDPQHIEACRKAILTYAAYMIPHLPELAHDIIERYGKSTTTPTP